MSEKLKERNQMDSAYQWDLSSLFKDDGEWEEALSDLEKKMTAVSALAGKLNDAAAIRDYYDKMTDLMVSLEDVFCYASLRNSEDTSDAKGQAMFARCYAKYVETASAIAFAEPEILALDDQKLASIAASDELKDYAFKLKDLIRGKKHRLSADQEKMLAMFGEVFNVPERASSALMDADMTFESTTDSSGQTHPLSSSSFILMESNPDRLLRESAFHSFYKSYKNHINTLGATYAGAVKTAVTEAKLRGYSSSRAMAMFADNIPETVYDNLIAAVHGHMDAMYRYLKLRKRLLGVDELHYYDLYAPLAPGKPRSYSYEEAQEMVLAAVKPLGEKYASIVKGAFKEGWIDVYPNKGKTGGAFSSGSYHSKPYILTNFTGTLDSVSTIAHEMGHSLHSWFTKNHQPPQYAGYSLFVAEVASTVNENLLIESLLAKEDDPAERLALLNQYLEGFKGTVYRQTMFAEFEKAVHEAACQGGDIDPETLSNIYSGLIDTYFGSDLIKDEEVRYEWARIPHFYRPFYVYVYATGYTSAVALSEAILKEGPSAAERYLAFLSMGGSAYPLDELKFAGIDLSGTPSIDAALTKFDKIITEAEGLADKLGFETK